MTLTDKPRPRLRYHFQEITPDKPMRIPIVDGDRRNASRALNAAYAWGKRNHVRLYGCTMKTPDQSVTELWICISE